MNEKEIAELRRRYKPEKSSITHIRGCYVNETGEIVSDFNQPLALLSEEESEKFLSLLKRTLSGTLEKNLIDIAFTTQQVVDSPEHKLLMALRNSSLNDTEAVGAFFQRTIESVNLEGNYLILLACDSYDVPYRSRDGERQNDASSEVFRYILCSICPVKATQPALSYYIRENEFHNRQADWLVSPPELGFLFPAFDDRSTNLYNALYYTKDVTENHKEFVDAVFRSEVPMPAAIQRETFQAILEDTLDDACNFDMVHAVHEQFCEMIAEHKESKEPEPLVLSKTAVKRVLSSCGADETKVVAFEEQYDARFGAETTLSPRNLVEPKQFEVRTPEVTIKVSPERVDMVETRIIDGIKYILIRADEGVEVNGVAVHI